MTRIHLLLCALLGYVWLSQAASTIATGDPAYLMRGERYGNELVLTIAPPESRPLEQLHGMFATAQAVRQQHQFARADTLYATIVLSTNNGSTQHQELRMWVQLQHADLLMRHILPTIHENSVRAFMKTQAIAKFNDALQLSQVVPMNTHGGPTFGAAEQVHAYNSMGTMAMELGDFGHASAWFHRAIALAPRAHEPLANLALVLSKLGRVRDAEEINRRALQLQPDDARLLHNMGMIMFQRGDDEQAEAYWNQALHRQTDMIETLTSLATIRGSRGDAVEARRFLEQAELVSPSGPIRQSIRLQRALSHLKLIYDSHQDIVTSRHQFEMALLAFLRSKRVELPDVRTTIGSGSMGYYAIYQGYNDRQVRTQLATIYQENAGDELNFVAAHVHTGRYQRYELGSTDSFASFRSPSPVVTLRRRIRVGFLSSFLRHHSVGLLLSGVVRHLSRDQFEVIAIVYDSMPRDPLTQNVLESVDQWIVLPEHDLRHAQRLVAKLELDILVFSELGMHASSYFLAFSQLALRSVVFWGHAVTSGIPTIDYFVSSTLYRQNQTDSDDQNRYTECLYEMRGLTTLFPRPPAPQSGLFRASFGLPDKSTMANMVLIPQTLYKLHPDFDTIIQQLLSLEKSSFLVLPVGDTPLLVQQLTQRWRKGGILSASVYKRIFFVRKMTQTEFLALCEMSDLVLDPFPVGGGRSSFEVFSVGTPILGVTTRTTILQLTLGMYRRMGLDPQCCMFGTVEKLVTRAVELLRNPRKRRALRDQIQRNSHKLYESSNLAVVREWEQFFKQILASDPPLASMVSQEDSASRDCVVTGPREEVPKSQLVYEMQMSGATPVHGSDGLLTVRLFDQDDPFDVASRLVPQDILQVAFLGKVLFNIQQRFRRRVIDTFTVNASTVSNITAQIPIAIREGDELFQTVRWQLKASHAGGIHDALVSQVLAIANARVPQHTSQQWRDARALVPIRSFEGSLATATGLNDCVALVVTTCKRVALFLQTMASLESALGITHHAQWHQWFCFVLVVDDNSTQEDRQRMQHAYPSFQYYWKTPLQKGHAQSLNLALRMVHGIRFLFYLEDDWVFRSSAVASKGQFVSDALAILRSTNLAQVLFNDQLSGWTTQLRTSGSSDRVVTFAIHEFGITDPHHTFAYWPGFSLNPGVWDLHKLRFLLEEADGSGGNGAFQEDSDLFEREFSLLMWRSGLETGYLKGTSVCDHIGAPPGTNASAYVLNGLPRRFD